MLSGYKDVKNNTKGKDKRIKYSKKQGSKDRENKYKEWKERNKKKEERQFVNWFIGSTGGHHHPAVCLTTGSKPLPKRSLHILRPTASSFK